MSIELTGLRGYALGMARRAVKDIRRDNFRQLRKYVDLCALLSKGTGHKLFFERVQDILEKTDSLYYPLIQRAIDSTSEEAACTIGINVGLDAMTFGAGRMQQLARSGAALAPWLTVANGAEPGLDVLIGHREEQGQYLWVLRARDAAEAERAMALAGHHPKTCFALLADAELVTRELADALQPRANLLTLLAVDRLEISEEVHNAAQLLQEHKLSFGLTLPLNDDTAAQALQCEWQSVLAEHSLFCIYSLRHMTGAAADRFTKAVWKQRMTTGASALPLLWERDTAYVSQRLAPGAWTENRLAPG